MASSRLFIFGLGMLVVTLNLVAQTEGFSSCYKNNGCKGEPFAVSLYNI